MWGVLEAVTVHQTQPCTGPALWSRLGLLVPVLDEYYQVTQATLLRVLFNKFTCVDLMECEIYLPAVHLCPVGWFSL